MHTRPTEADYYLQAHTHTHGLLKLATTCRYIHLHKGTHICIAQMVGSVPLYSGSIKAKLNQLIKSAPAAVLHIVYLFVPITFIIV